MVHASRRQFGTCTQSHAGASVRCLRSLNGTPPFPHFTSCLKKRQRQRAFQVLAMRELAALQARFSAGIYDRAADADLPGMFLGEETLVSKRVAIYRNNTLANAARALEAAYPVVAKMVGMQFFAGLTRQYSLRFPSKSGDLNEYGEAFAEFLAGFAPTTELPYLAEVARLEWQVHRAHYAADAIAFDAARLTAIAP